MGLSRITGKLFSSFFFHGYVFTSLSPVPQQDQLNDPGTKDTDYFITLED
jgi:hypothetical protein